jgi:hypothetical protein
MDDSDTNLDEINSLVNQLKQNNTLIKDVPREADPLKKENAEKFVIEKAGQLVQESMELLREIKINLSAASFVDADSVAAISSLTGATAASIDLLNKLIIADKKNETTIKAKQLEIEARKQLADEGPVQLLITREELLKNLITKVSEKTKVIDVESEPPNNL